MELALLRSFLALAGQLDFGRTARLLNVSQRALTKRIRQLESEIGGQLFHRGRDGTRLTDVGGLLLDRAGELEGKAPSAPGGLPGRGIRHAIPGTFPDFSSAISACRAGTRGVRVHPISDKEALWTVGAAWRKGEKSVLVARFLELLKKELNQKSQLNESRSA